MMEREPSAASWRFMCRADGVQYFKRGSLYIAEPIKSPAGILRVRVWPYYLQSSKRRSYVSIALADFNRDFVAAPEFVRSPENVQAASI